MRINLALVLLGLLVACGDDGSNKLTDGGSGSHDGPTGDGSGGTSVTIAVTLDGSASAGNAVYFLNADSSVVSSTTTGADGKASAVMAAGGTVTLVEPGGTVGSADAPSEDFLDTFAGVKPGDVLKVDLFDGNATPPATTDITFNITVPTDITAGVTSYEVDSSCGTADITPAVGSGSGSGSAGALVGAHAPRAVALDNPPQSITLSDCTGGSADIVIATRNDAGDLVHAIYVPGQAVADGSAVTIAGTYVVPPTDPVAYTNLGSDVTDASSVIADITAKGLIQTQQPFGADITITGGSGSGSVPNPVTNAVTQLHETSVDTNGFTSQSGADWGPGSNALYKFDGSTELLPSFTADPAVSAAAVTWTVSGGTRTADATFVLVDYDRAAGSGSGSAASLEHEWQWDILAPGSTTGVTFPKLPVTAGGFDFNPTAADSASIEQVENQTFPGGYDAIRPDYYGIDYFALIAQSATGSIEFADASFADQQQVRVRHAATVHVAKHQRAPLQHGKRSKRTRLTHR